VPACPEILKDSISTLYKTEVSWEEQISADIIILQEYTKGIPKRITSFL
jgi:hypothetical protein